MLGTIWNSPSRSSSAAPKPPTATPATSSGAAANAGEAPALSTRGAAAVTALLVPALVTGALAVVSPTEAGPGLVTNVFAVVDWFAEFDWLGVVGRLGMNVGPQSLPEAMMNEPACVLRNLVTSTTRRCSTVVPRSF